MTRSLAPLLAAGLAAVVLAGCGGNALDVADSATYSVCGLLHLIAVIWAFVQIAGSLASQGTKILWALVVFFMPLVGLILWYFAGPKRA